MGEAAGCSVWTEPRGDAEKLAEPVRWSGMVQTAKPESIGKLDSGAREIRIQPISRRRPESQRSFCDPEALRPGSSDCTVVYTVECRAWPPGQSWCFFSVGNGIQDPHLCSSLQYNSSCGDSSQNPTSSTKPTCHDGG